MMRKVFPAIVFLFLMGTSGCTLVISNRPLDSTPQLSIDGDVSGPYAVLSVPPTSLPTATMQTLDAPVNESPTALLTATQAQPEPTSTPDDVSDLVSLLTTPTSSELEQSNVREVPTAIPLTPTATAISETPVQLPTEQPPMTTVEIIPAAVNSSEPATDPQIYETEVTVDTYDYESALVPTSQDDPVYPYPRLNHDQVGPPTPRNYRAIVLENRYLKLTVLPNLGGRIYRWIDKASGKNLFYENPVIKPTQWGHRGWWLATGGMEWALPLDEHGLSEASPWDYTLFQSDDTVGVTLSDTEEYSGLMSEINISIDADHSYFTLTPRIINPTDESISYKFWLNGMFGLGSQRIGPELEFVLPDDQVMVHSTGDTTLPGEGQPMDWPDFSGRDMSDYENWGKFLGIFAAPAQKDYMGAYNHQTNLGVVRVFPHELARGAKIFAPGDLDPALWTTDDSSYFELWGGLAPTFWDEVMLDPGQWVTWNERWYAVGDMGGFKFANEEAVLNLGLTNGSVQVAVASTHAVDGHLILWQDGQEMIRWPLSLSPEHPFRGSFAAGSGNPETWGLSLIDDTSREVASLGQTQSEATKGPSLESTPSVTIPPTPSFTPTPDYTLATPEATASATPVSQLVWDPRLSDLNIEVSRAQVEPGQSVYRLVSARFQDEQEANGLHHVFVEVLDENGQRVVGQPVNLSWKDGTSTMITEDKPSPEYAANAPLYGKLEDGAYKVYVDDTPSDVVSGLGLPGKHHVSYQLVFQREVATSEDPPPIPTRSTPTPTPTPTTVTPPVSDGQLIWDPRLNDLGLEVTRTQSESDQPVFRLVAAHYQDEQEANGLHHVFVEVLDENGQRIVGQPVNLSWGDDQAVLITEDKPSPEYAANAPLYGEISAATYEVDVAGGTPSDKISGLGLPGSRHVNYLLTFQRKRS